MTTTRLILGRALPALLTLALTTAAGAEAPPAPPPLLPATAYAVPKELTNQGSGYFAIIEGLNGKLYVGTAKYGVNAYLVEFDPKTAEMKVVVDCHKEIGTTATGFAAQSKIHTRNNLGPSGKIYFATKQGYPDEAKGEKRSDYPGGYPMVYDPATGKTKVYPIPVPQQGIISITPDESRGLAYLSTCSDSRPLESTHFMVLDLEKGTYRDLMDCQHMYAFIVVDHLGRAYHPVLGGDVARYDPRSDKLERLKQTVDGSPPKPDSHLADPESHPINWDVTRDGKTLYALPMSGNQLYAYDLTAEGGDTLAGKSLGPLVAGAQSTDCRGMCVGPTNEVWAAVTAAMPGGENQVHLVSYRPGDAAPRDHGVLFVKNPDFTPFTDAAGKDLPWHHGFKKADDGTLRPLYPLGICQGSDRSVYVLSLIPFTVLKVTPPN